MPYIKFTQGVRGEKGEKGDRGYTGDKGDIGINPRGPFVLGTHYYVRDLVTDAGNAYICTTEHDNAVLTNTGYWIKYVSKGDKGDTGERGIQGAAGTGSGDMLLSVYDPNEDGIFSADIIEDGTTNKVYTSTEKTKLSGIESNADITDSVNVGSSIHGVSSKTSIVDNDEIPLIDSEASNVLKKSLWSNIKSLLKTYFDTLYPSSNTAITGATKTKITYDSKGLVTAGTDLSSTDIPNLDASKITTGIFDIARIPAAALERMISVADQTARYALTTTSVQLGDTVKQIDTGLLYIVVDTDNLGNSSGYQVYTAGSAASVPWSGVTDKPTTYSADLIVDGTTNKAYTATEKTKLSGIEAAADVTDAGNVGYSVYGTTAKTTLAYADEMPIIDSEASNVLKKATLTNIQTKVISPIWSEQQICQVTIPVGATGWGAYVGRDCTASSLKVRCLDLAGADDAPTSLTVSVYVNGTLQFTTTAITTSPATYDFTDFNLSADDWVRFVVSNTTGVAGGVICGLVEVRR